MKNIKIPQAVTAIKGINGLKASQYVYLDDVVTPDGRACLNVHTAKSGMSITTHYQFGYRYTDSGMSGFTALVLSDYSGRMNHAAKRATAKAVNEAHAAAMLPDNLQPHILAAAKQHGISV